MQTNKVRIISYVTPELREQLSEAAEDEATSESGIVTRALLMLFRERSRLADHIKSEKMLQQYRGDPDAQGSQIRVSAQSSGAQGAQARVAEE